MATSFYGVLGVVPDADAAAIRRGYRERVMDVHPDVNDAPDADAEFRRLTTARDTLLDESERNRYDRLGHRVYVQRHSDCSAWTSMLEETRDRTRTTGSAAESNTRVSRESAESNANASTTANESRRSWRAQDWASTTGTGGSQSTTSENRTYERTATARGRTSKASERTARKGEKTNPQSVGGSYATSSFWESQRVGERRETGRRRRAPLATRLIRGLRELGPWVLVHVVFLTIAAGTCWYVYAIVLSDGATSLPLLLALIGEVVLAVVLSTIHVFTRLYR